MKKIENIAFIGTGKWGQTTAYIISDPERYINKPLPNYNITLYDVDKERLKLLKEIRENEKVFEDVKNKKVYCNFGKTGIKEKIRIEENLETAVKNADLVVITTASTSVKNVCKNINNELKNDTKVLCLSKGVEEYIDEKGRYNIKTMYDVMEENLPHHIKKGVMYGPNISTEILLGLEAISVVSTKAESNNEFDEYADSIKSVFNVKNFKVISNHNLILVETGASAKNAYAIAAGMHDKLNELKTGKKLSSSNPLGFLIPFAFKEEIEIYKRIKKLKLTFSERIKTFLKDNYYSHCFLGDLVTTCSSSDSRNYKLGQKLSEGKTVDEAVKEIGETVEGINSTKVFYNLFEKETISEEVPLLNEIYQVLFNSKKPEDAVKTLVQLADTHERDSFFNR